MRVWRNLGARRFRKPNKVKISDWIGGPETPIRNFLTLEMKQPTSKKEPIPLGYKHDDPKKHLSSYMKALGVTYPNASNWRIESSLEFKTLFLIGRFCRGTLQTFF